MKYLTAEMVEFVSQSDKFMFVGYKINSWGDVYLGVAGVDHLVVNAVGLIPDIEGKSAVGVQIAELDPTKLIADTLKMGSTQAINFITIVPTGSMALERRFIKSLSAYNYAGE